MRRAKESRPTIRSGATIPEVANARFWAAFRHGGPRPDDGDIGVLFLECERWVDARQVAQRVFAGDVTMARIEDADMRKKPIPRIQVRWVGTAAGLSPDLRMQIRNVRQDGKIGMWRDL